MSRVFRPQSGIPYSRIHSRAQVFSNQVNKQHILDVIDKLNDKELQRVVDKVIEIKEESAKEENNPNNTTIDNEERD